MQIRQVFQKIRPFKTPLPVTCLTFPFLFFGTMAPALKYMFQPGIKNNQLQVLPVA